MVIKLNSYNKYRNKSVVLDNYTFASRKEGDRYSELLLLQRAKKIKDLSIHPEFILQEEFLDSQGEKHRAITYIADFAYFEIDNTKEHRNEAKRTGSSYYRKKIVEDTKGFKTKDYLIKKKLFLFKYRDVIFKEI